MESTDVVGRLDEDLAMLQMSPLYEQLKSLGLPLFRRLSLHDRMIHYTIAGRLWKVALPITFTPFASTQPCSARCVFCSETLVHKEASTLSATLRPDSAYFEGLQRALLALRDLPLCYSLSGLEATDQAAWLEDLLDVLQTHQDDGGKVEEKVLYSNAAGLARETTGERLLPRLRAFDLTRLEISRHHNRQENNDAIMRFRRGQPIQEQAIFERTLRDLLDIEIPVRLVCVLQVGGVDSIKGVWDYLAWAASFGVKDVVFREYSRLHHLYQENQTYRHIESHRVVLEDLLAELFSQPLPQGCTWSGLTVGYYFWNIEMRTAEGVRVTFETSDYQAMKARHRSDTLYKLVYHANGHLCGDWDPSKSIVWSASSTHE
ncbi:MAG: hypothetical protein H6728_01845 [Myxococcales bacterium]|nr:hypothetical protein [Myxococcales bacterium]MCB9641794.1 hypothetical protein [Myxococcales bacterium]